jgi:hypothetical protein
MKGIAKGAILVFACVSCADPDPATESITRAPTNNLGIQSLVSTHYELDGEKHFELRGLGADDTELGRFHMRIGAMPDMEPIWGMEDVGTEVNIKAGADAPRIQTRQVPIDDLDGVMPGMPDANAFLAVIAGDLKKEIQVDVLLPEVAETAYSGVNCLAEHLRTTPVAKDCCYNMVILPSESHNTYFNIDAAPTHLKRRYTPSVAWKCRTATGGNGCSGSGCTYGPCGFKKMTEITNGSMYPVIATGGSCTWTWSATRVNTSVPDVTGTCAYTDCLNGNPVVGGSSGYWYSM